MSELLAICRIAAKNPDCVLVCLRTAYQISELVKFIKTEFKGDITLDVLRRKNNKDMLYHIIKVKGSTEVFDLNVHDMHKAGYTTLIKLDKATFPQQLLAGSHSLYRQNGAYLRKVK